MDIMLPPLSQRLRELLRMLADNERRLTSRFSAPDVIRENNNLIENTLIKIMEEIEKGPGTKRIW